MSTLFDLKPFAHRRVCVALSGGGDSAALFHFMAENATQYRIALSAVNVEHGIRGESSRADTRFVQELCARRGVPLYCFAANVPARAKERGEGVEEAARRCRGEIFAKLLADDRADCIVTAHHAGDNAESVLFNLFRGSALTGAGGIRAYIPAEEFIARFLPEGSAAARDLHGRGVFRPLLAVPKGRILQYLRENHLEWREDETNADTAYTRNFLRREILAEAEKAFPEAESRLYDFSRAAREDDDFLYSLTDAYYEEGEECRIGDAPKPVFLRACVRALKHFGVHSDYTRTNLEDIFALTQGENGKTIDLPQGLCAARDYGRVAIYRPQGAPLREYPFAAGDFDFGCRRVKVRRGEQGEPNGSVIGRTLFLDGNKLPAGSVLRLRLPGDVFEKFGGGTKKLKEYLIDKKIPRRERDLLPVLACGREIYAICGVEISEKVRVDGFGAPGEKTTDPTVYTVSLFTKGEE